MPVTLTNPEKLLWPADGITKADLAGYYERLAEHLLTEVQGRPLTVVRAPNGIDGQRFFQKNAPRGTPDWVETITLPAPSAKRDVSYVLCNTADTLSWLGNQAALEFHPMLSRAQDVGRPDLIVFDLDPPEERFDLARRGAVVVRGLLEKIGLRPALKTTGGKGLHLYTPIEPEHEFGEVMRVASEVATQAVDAEPELLTLEFSKADRGDRVLVDIGRNAFGATTVAAYSPRARAGAPVSFPVSWAAIEDVDPRAFTLRTVPGLLGSGGPAEWRAITTTPQRLPVR